MTRPFVTLCTALLMVLASGSPQNAAIAQELPMKRGEDGQKIVPVIDPCLITPEEIIPLRLPDFDQAAPWKKLSGHKGEDIARAVMAVRDGGAIAVGEARVIDDQKKIGKPQIRMMRTNRVGKVIAENWVPLPNLTHVRDAVLVKDRIVVLAQLDEAGEGGYDMALVELSGTGELKATHKIMDRAVVTPVSMTTQNNGETVVVVARAANIKHPEDTSTIIMWLDRTGRVLSRKEYLPGVPSQPEFITRLPDNALLVTGRIKADDGRDAGWIMKLSSFGDIMFQRPYARGQDATLRSGLVTKDGYIIAVGDAIPADGEDKAAWIMKLDHESGNPLWQKYLTGKYIYGARDAIELPDNRVSVLLAGQVSSNGGRSHARVTTLSPQGIVVADESFVEGSGTLPLRMILQGERRTILGMAETGFSDKDASADMKYEAYDLWMMGLAQTPTSPYVCKPTRTQELDTLP